MRKKSAIFFLNFLAISASSASTEIDQEGYILFCPCMGRFGNQADNYLGTLAFAKGLNRTLVLAPWVEYRDGRPNSVQVPFETYFDVEVVKEFHRVITMEDFMEKLAPRVWKEKDRISFCFAERPAIGGNGNENEVCNAKDGNPFGPFWDTFNVTFTGSELYGKFGLNHDVLSEGGGEMAERWKRRYPADKWPVLAFTGAPAAFPVRRENVGIQKYLHWNEVMRAKAEAWIKANLPGPFIGIHLRNGPDWAKACDLIPSVPRLFSSAQCLGYDEDVGAVTKDMCLPNLETLVAQIRRTANEVGATVVFVASDHDHKIHKLSRAFKNRDLKFFKLRDPDPHLDLIILGKSDHFIGNCVSSFTAFVKRERDIFEKRPTTFWGRPPYGLDYQRDEF